jgi:hypothetical protein
MADEITMPAPNGRVDLEALKRPRLGGKEPSDNDKRDDLHTRYAI